MMMDEAMAPQVSRATIQRLPLYHVVLKGLRQRGRDRQVHLA